MEKTSATYKTITINDYLDTKAVYDVLLPDGTEMLEVNLVKREIEERAHNDRFMVIYYYVPVNVHGVTSLINVENVKIRKSERWINGEIQAERVAAKKANALKSFKAIADAAAKLTDSDLKALDVDLESLGYKITSNGNLLKTYRAMLRKTR